MSLSAASCCSLLLASHPHLRVAYPGSQSYNATQAAFWSIQESSLTPACVVTPSSTQDVSDIITTLTAPNCRRDCAFALKAQGHAPAAGFANIGAPGLTVDLTALNSVTLNPHTGVARVGAGASWLQVYSALDPHGRTVAGGRNGQVGVGGLTLGGGISYFSPQAGFTCDSVVNYEVVLANGRVANANASAYPDLFRALKGGAGNFAVVTRFDFATLPVGEILAGSIGNDIGQRQAVFEAFAGIAGAKQYDVHASVVVGMGFASASKAWTLSSTPIYTKPVRDPPVYRELFAVPQLSNNLNLTKLHVFANESDTPPLNWMFQTATFGVSAAFLGQVFDICNETIYGFNVAGGIIWEVAFEPLPTVFVAQGAGKNVLGTGPADGNGVVMLLTTLWPDSSSDAPARAQAIELLGRINSAAKKAGLLKEFTYANYADAAQKPFAGYGVSNENFLKQTAKKYDPLAVFQKQVPGGFKLSH